MAKDEKPIDTSLELYKELMAMADSEEDIHDILGVGGKIAWDNSDDDSEDVFTSKEIVQKKKLLEKASEKKGITSDDDGIIEEDVYFKRYRNVRQHRYTESEMVVIRESCMTSVVHDYGEHDPYHISDEERQRNDQLKEISDQLAGLKRTYRRVDQYIAAMRIVFEAWQILARNNFIHSEEEFFDMIGEGRIVSSRIVMPKLRKMDQYNIDMIINYISNPELDLSHLAPIKKEEQDDWFENPAADQVKANLMELLTTAELSMIHITVESSHYEFTTEVECRCDACLNRIETELDEIIEELRTELAEKITNESQLERRLTEAREEHRKELVVRYEIDLTEHEVVDDDQDDLCIHLRQAIFLIRQYKSVIDVEGRQETEKEEMYRILRIDEAAAISYKSEDPLNADTRKISDIPQKYIKGYDKRQTSFRKKKKKKKGNKTDRYITDQLHGLLSKIQNGQHYKEHGNSYMVTHSLFEQEKPLKSFWDDIHFDASWADDDAVAILDLVLREELMRQRPIKQKHLTYADLDIARFFEILEDQGVNTVYLRQQMGVSEDSNNKKVIAATKKENKAKEKALLNRVIKLHDDKKFKKIAEKAEKDLNEHRKGEIPGL